LSARGDITVARDARSEGLVAALMTRFLGLEGIVAVPHPIDRDSSAMLRLIPMTREAFDRLESEIERLTQALPSLQGAAQIARGDDHDAELALPTAWELHRHEQRLEALRRLLSLAHLVLQDGMAIVGSRVLVRDSDGSTDSYTLVAPGEADPRAGRISFESPLGRALLGCRAGETAAVAAPDGVRWVRVVEVDRACGPAP
jgi:transcription elongation factor GreA